MVFAGKYPAILKAALRIHTLLPLPTNTAGAAARTACVLHAPLSHGAAAPRTRVLPGKEHAGLPAYRRLNP